MTKKSIEKLHGKKSEEKLDQPMRNEVALSIRNGCQIRDEEELGFNA